MIAPILTVLGGVALAAAQWMIYFYAPTEMSMGLIQKIFYLHLPLAWWALFSYFLLFCGSVVFIFKRRDSIDNFCAACAEIGVLFNGLALLTGMIWAKKAWGVWWTWDPRLTTTLVMWFIYAAYLVIRQMEMPPHRKKLVCAVLGIVAFLDVPLVFFSARIFRSIHPAVFASKSGGMEPEMRVAAIFCVLALGLLWLGLLLLRTRQLDMREKLDELLFDIVSKKS